MKRAVILKHPRRERQLSLFDSLRETTTENVDSMATERVQNRKALEELGWKPLDEPPITCMSPGCYQSLERWRRRKKGRPTEFKYVSTDTLADHELLSQGNHADRNRR
jgi:hypothetical protein